MSIFSLVVGNHYREIERALQSNSCDITTRNEIGQSALHVAVQEGFVDVVELLLKFDYDVNARDAYGNCPLHYGVKSNHIECIESLLQNKANVELRNNFGSTSIDLSTENGTSDITDLLIKSDQNISCKWCDNRIKYCERRLHEKECEAIEIPCPQYCGQKIKRSMVTQHKLSDCPCTKMSCPAHCGATFIRSFKMTHEKFNCPAHKLVTCRFGCEGISVTMLAGHEAGHVSNKPIKGLTPLEAHYFFFRYNPEKNALARLYPEVTSDYQQIFSEHNLCGEAFWSLWQDPDRMTETLCQMGFQLKHVKGMMSILSTLEEVVPDDGVYCSVFESIPNKNSKVPNVVFHSILKLDKRLSYMLTRRKLTSIERYEFVDRLTGEVLNNIEEQARTVETIIHVRKRGEGVST
eukprot:TRINITY_DN51609_c0_g1_i1.p1 TRINITY_DN51609_c0_g1~~TRINITY_DN51609_c0_g1_i1.p1  ORF type:complete len:407 (+),score=67.77 TRINITY_DN51609_c0_g1_i1:79-1299(+)